MSQGAHISLTSLGELVGHHGRRWGNDPTVVAATTGTVSSYMVPVNGGPLVPTPARATKQEAKEAIEEVMADVENVQLTLTDYLTDFNTLVADTRKAKARLDRKYNALKARCLKLGVRL